MLFQKTEKNATKIKFTFAQKLWDNFNKKRFLALRSSLASSITFCYVIYYEGIFFAIGLEYSFLFLSHLTFFDFQATSPMMPFTLQKIWEKSYFNPWAPGAGQSGHVWLLCIILRFTEVIATDTFVKIADNNFKIFDHLQVGGPPISNPYFDIHIQHVIATNTKIISKMRTDFYIFDKIEICSIFLYLFFNVIFMHSEQAEEFRIRRKKN